MSDVNDRIGNKSVSLPFEPDSGAGVADAGDSVSTVGVGTGARVADATGYQVGGY